MVFTELWRQRPLLHTGRAERPAHGQLSQGVCQGLRVGLQV